MANTLLTAMVLLTVIEAGIVIVPPAQSQRPTLTCSYYFPSCSYSLTVRFTPTNFSTHWPVLAGDTRQKGLSAMFEGASTETLTVAARGVFLLVATPPWLC
jgi:hypothetical protein